MQYYKATYFILFLLVNGDVFDLEDGTTSLYAIKYFMLMKDGPIGRQASRINQTSYNEYYQKVSRNEASNALREHIAFASASGSYQLLNYFYF